LRVANGNLSAVLVAEAFGLSINELAGSLGRSRQALGKTPDADSIQNQLAFFERVGAITRSGAGSGLSEMAAHSQPGSGR